MVSRMRIESMPFQISQMFMNQNTMKQMNWARPMPINSGNTAGRSPAPGQTISTMV